jgi:2,3-bisphosphoglycerate-independent phosphoglycerate mutase
MSKVSHPILLLILDGWGCREESSNNPTKNTPTPTLDLLQKNYPHTLLQASGPAVGLPAGQIGNSEVGHLHIGAGRKVPQDLVRVNNDIDSGLFFQNPVLLKTLQQAKKTGKSVHILGLLSPGGVHSQEQHLFAMIRMIAEQGITQNYLHAFLDGRDVPPQSALPSLQKAEALYASLPGGKIASLIGRYYAMDRDKRWERTQQAYDLLTLGTAYCEATSAIDALQSAYQRAETDEFVSPTAIHGPNENPITIQDGDVVIFMNYRADRARQLTHAFIDAEFTGFQRTLQPKLNAFVSLTQYAKDLPTTVVYPPFQLTNNLGEFLSAQGLHQLRIAETEKYAHVTYFLNGRVEQAYANEERILIPSPKVATYDLQPEMSAIELTDRLLEAIESSRYDVIICNYANPDMIGHTGVEAAANQTVKIMDECMHRILKTLEKTKGECLITADHGNIEMMYDAITGQPHTAHTENPVPFIYFGRKAKFMTSMGALDDVAPTLLHILGLAQPSEMTGQNLLQFIAC